MKKIIFSCVVWVILYVLSGCQPTPEQDVVVNKGKRTLEEAIKEDNTQAATDQIPADYKDSFSSGSGDVAIAVDAKVLPVDSPLPVIRVAPHEITAEEVQRWAEVLFDGNTAYEPDVVMTKTELEEQILMLKEKLSNREALEEAFGDETESTVKLYEEMLASYEQDYQTAPEEREDMLCQWKFHPLAYYWDMKEGDMDFDELSDTWALTAVTKEADGMQRSVEATNRKESDYKMNLLWYAHRNTITMQDYTPPYQEMTADEAQAAADETISRLGLDSWTVASVAGHSMEAPSAHVVTYTPVLETVPVILGPVIDLQSEDMYAANYEYSSLRVYVVNGEIQAVELTSPMDIVQVENSNVAVLDFEKIYETFQNQMRVAYTRDTFIDPADPSLQGASVECKVTQIEQGLFRIKEKNQEENFLMVPAWTFRGSVIVDGSDWGEQDFCVINAVDGSVINTAAGY